jgi:prepilin-type N-terminal cleavage/methylation domain-containing protein
MKLITYNSKSKASFGFTLIELLVVIVVLGILGVVGTDLFSSVIKGTNKANIISEVKQNGQLVMDIIERNIREATEATNPILTPGSPPTYDTTSLVLTTPSGTVTFGFDAECKTCTPPTNGQITMNTSPITSTDTKTGVSVTSVSYTILPPPTPSPAAPSVILVSMTINQGAQAPTRKDFTANVVLTTTVALRTY